MKNNPIEMPLGPVMLDVEGLTLTEADKTRLLHPLTGAVILFARNFTDPDQVKNLIIEIEQLRTPKLLIAVDQEGGRVQRFQNGFTRLPAAATFGELWNQDSEKACEEAKQSAITMADELIEVGVDFSFAPVFDVTSKESEVIGDRCFHPDPVVATQLLKSYIQGMSKVGMAATAKHFPGHGGVHGDSHHCLPQDERRIADVEQHDLLPYRELVNDIKAVMSAHVLFNNCDPDIPTHSQFWLKTVLRDQLGFEGIVFSDDLTMQGAIDAQAQAGDGGLDSGIVESAISALDAGCDMVLVCNRPDLADDLLEGLQSHAVADPHALQKLSSRLLNLRAGA